MTTIIVPMGVYLSSIVLVDWSSTVSLTAVPVDVEHFQRKFDAGRWRGRRKRQKAARRLARLRRDQWECTSFTFGTL